MTRLTMVLPLGAALALSGCADYLNNRDTVSFGAGDAVAWNRAAHTVKPWNRNAYDTSIATAGTEVDGANKRLLLIPVPVVAPEPVAQ